MAVLSVAAQAQAQAQAPQVVRVPVRDLEQRPELVGRELIVEARGPTFTFEREQGWNNFTVERSNVRFRLPKVFALAKPSSQPVISVRGKLQKSPQGILYFDVTAPPEFLPGDLERLTTAAERFVPDDIESRRAWAEWGLRRADEYEDEALAEAARRLAGEAIALEAAQPANAGPFRQLELAARARQLQVPEPAPSALVHRGARERLPRLQTVEEAEALAKTLAELLPPAAQVPTANSEGPVGAEGYERDPAAAYLAADPAARAALDRRLLADVLQKSFEFRAIKAPDQLLTLADQAETELPDRPQVARALRLRGLGATDVRELKLNEVQERARLFDSLGEPQQARDLIRSWLDAQRVHHLAVRDVEGRLNLAEQYVALAGDHRTAETLLREAWDLAPGDPEVASAFRARGFRLEGDQWVAPTPAAREAGPAAVGPGGITPAASGADPYRGLTRPQVIAMIGNPDSVSRLVTQGQLREQWLYRRDRLYLNFVQRPGTSSATVSSSVRVDRLLP